MRRKYKIFYHVEPNDNWWWIPSKRKWGKLPCGASASSNCRCKTFDKAMKAARKVPTGQVIISQYKWKNGTRIVRDYIFRKNYEN